MYLMSMFVGILNEAFEVVKADLANKKNDTEIVDFIVGSIKNISKKKVNSNVVASSSICLKDESLHVNVKKRPSIHSLSYFTAPMAKKEDETFGL